MSTWVIPGAALQKGCGWRLWFSKSGTGVFPEPAITVSRRSAIEPISTIWRQENLPLGEDRRIGVLTVTLNSPSPGAAYDISVADSRLQPPLRLRSLPSRVEPSGFSFMLGSCFWRDNDKEGSYAAALTYLNKRWKTSFKLLVGDQLYADWPWDFQLRVTKRQAYSLYAERYHQYWGDALLREGLQTSPNFVTCDDHEFWNNYPEYQPHIGRASTRAKRRLYGKVARTYYDLYQANLNPDGARWYSFVIEPVSFFVTDCRSERSLVRGPQPSFLSSEQWRGLESWFHDLRGPGVLVLGQPLYEGVGGWKDYGLPDYVENYQRLWRLIRQSLAGDNSEGAPHDILILSGDIHTGRLAIRHLFGMAVPGEVTELVASPASMVKPGAKKKHAPPGRIYVGPAGRPQRVADVQWDRVNEEPATLDHNLAVVRVTPGRNNRIRFQLMLYSIRPYDERSWWDKLRGIPRPRGSIALNFGKELELR